MWHIAGQAFDTSQPLLMGILNVTPDSFSDGGLYGDARAAVAHGLEMVAAGADIIDVGGESTRPGSGEVGVEEELERVLPVVRELAAAGVAVSIDTRHAVVARACVKVGASIINDVSGFRDPAMVELAASCDAGLIVMHMAGEPKTMQQAPSYDDVVAEVRGYLLQQAALLEAAGVALERICIDPGPGFGKDLQHNAKLLERFGDFVATGYPVCAAFSRKACIGAWYGGSVPSERVWGSVAVAVRAAARGAAVLRVHDVMQTCAALAAYRAYSANEADMANPIAVAGARGLSPSSGLSSELHTPYRHPRALIALGSNQGDRLAHLMHAVCKIAQLPACEVVAVSPIYESEPAYYTSQATFANAVLELGCGLLPQVLLAELQRIELEEGRVRSFANAPRPLDLDILDYEGICSSDPFCILPHPKLLERDFTVTPLLDVVPGHVLADGTPVTREAIAYGAIIGKLGELDLPLPGRVAALMGQSGSVASLLHDGVVCDSTNDEARRLALQGVADKTVVLAALQTGGRGRLGRTWESPLGGLYHSYVFRPNTTPDKLASFGLVVALGVLEALDELGVQGGGLKWPNDVLLPNGKVAGILLETVSAGSADPDAGTTLIAGVGINVCRRGKMALDEASENRPLGAAYISDVLVVQSAVAAVAAVVINHVWALYDEWTASGYSFAPFAKRYEERLLTLGEEVCVRRLDGSIEAEGIVEGIDAAGYLLVGGKAVATGDVTLRKD